MIMNRRVENLLNYLYLARTFRNSGQLIRAYRSGPPCETAVMWNGTQLRHPAGRGGLVGTILELWKDQCYTPRGFYTPQPGDWIVDAGAHVGLFSLFMARQQPACHILALEPFAENYACLLRNVEAARATQVTPLPLALGGRCGHATMQPVGERSIDHLLQSESTAEGQQVEVASLDDIRERIPSGKIAFLKLDVEGAEYDAFESVTQETLDNISRIAMEYHDNLRPGTLRLIQDRLAATHTLEVHPTWNRGYGLLLARHR